MLYEVTIFLRFSHESIQSVLGTMRGIFVQDNIQGVPLKKLTLICCGLIEHSVYYEISPKCEPRPYPELLCKTLVILIPMEVSNTGV